MRLPFRVNSGILHLMIYIKKVFILVLFVSFFGGISHAHAATEGNRYLIKSSSLFARRAIGNIKHDFGSSFSADIGSFQLRIAKMLKLDIERMDTLHISAKSGIEQEISIPTMELLQTDILVAILDNNDEHGAYMLDIIKNNGVEESRIKLYDVCNAKGICYADDVAVAIHKAVASGAKIINMSFGSDKASPLIDSAIKEAHENNVLLIAAAGNNGPFQDSIEYPASHPDVLAVGALGSDGLIAEWSSRGDVDAWEPGEYKTIAGTSVSAAYFTARNARLFNR